MNRVYVIGAGFSNASCPSAPLGRDLLRALEQFYDEYDFSSDNQWYFTSMRDRLEIGRKASSHFKEIVRSLHKGFLFSKAKVSTEFGHLLSSEYDVEMILSLLALNREIFRRSNIGYSDSLETHFYEFLNWTFVKRLGPQRLIDQNRVAKKLCQKLQKGDTVITFNYDLLLDKELFESGLWSPLKKTGNRIKCGYWRTDFYFQDRSLNDYVDQSLIGDSKVEFIKLHGSLNWYCLPFSKGAPIEVPDDNYMLAKLFNPEDGICYFNDELRLDFPIDFRRICSRLSVVKPTIGKEYSKRPYSNLVKRALSSIAKAQEIYVLGYSFPVYDTLSEFLILATNSSCKLYIVNKGEEADNLKERIVSGSDFEWEQVDVEKNGIERWLAVA